MTSSVKPIWKWHSILIPTLLVLQAEPESPSGGARSAEGPAPVTSVSTVVHSRKEALLLVQKLHAGTEWDVRAETLQASTLHTPPHCHLHIEGKTCRMGYARDAHLQINERNHLIVLRRRFLPRLIKSAETSCKAALNS